MWMIKHSQTQTPKDIGKHYWKITVGRKYTKWINDVYGDENTQENNQNWA